MGYTRRTVLLAGASTIAVSGCIGGEPDDDIDDDPDDDLPADDNDDDPDDQGDDDAGDELADDQSDDPAGDDPADDDPADDPGDDTDDDSADDANDDPDDDQNGGPDETVAVGADGGFTFDPETLEIDPGTTVLFVWEGDHHNIVVSERPDGADWEGVEDTHDDGFEHSHTFEVEGRYEYFCEPHQGQGMEGVVLVGGVEPGDEGNDGGDGGDDGDDDDDGGYY